MRVLFKSLWTKSNLIFPLLVVWLAFSGTVFVISATQYLPNPHYFSQYLFFCIGLIFFWIGTRINYEKLARVSLIFYIVSLFLLFLTIVLGRLRWIKIGPFYLQPYEFAKIAIVMFLAQILANGENLNDFRKIVFILLLVLLPPITMLICQPHFGACVLLFATSLAMLILRGIKFIHLIRILIMGVILLAILLVLAPYRLDRFKDIFVHDPLGKDYQREQALKAIGSGGPFGKGIGNSVMKFGFLPDAHTDFLFAIIAEELGFFLTCAAVLLPLGCFILTCFAVSFSSLSPLGALLAGGLASLFAIQSIINLAMVSSHWVPVVGLPLPFFAYGGSSLVSSCLAAGIINNIARSEKVKRRL